MQSQSHCQGVKFAPVFEKFQYNYHIVDHCLKSWESWCIPPHLREDIYLKKKKLFPYEKQFSFNIFRFSYRDKRTSYRYSNFDMIWTKFPQDLKIKKEISLCLSELNSCRNFFNPTVNHRILQDFHNIAWQKYSSSINYYIFMGHYF